MIYLLIIKESLNFLIKYIKIAKIYKIEAKY
jgi:hypothetical protein